MYMANQFFFLLMLCITNRILNTIHSVFWAQSLIFLKEKNYVWKAGYRYMSEIAER